MSFEQSGAGRMSRRFNDEPIQVIRRIPSPEQLDAVRSVKRPVGGKFGEAAASFARSVAERLASVTSLRPSAGKQESGSAFQGAPGEGPNEIGAEAREPIEGGADQKGMPKPSRFAVTLTPDESEADPVHSTAGSSAVQPEEVAELRSYLLQQQQDIVRLVAQMQELKSLVLSQQRLIERLAQEVAHGSVSLTQTGRSSAVARPNRLGRQKPAGVEKATMTQNDPMRLPLNV
ncbi:MAG: hypothetical protein NNA20_10100 [Nitrospira sp.]|nr:hypothetical protein [Nitrospira sp.]MCP9442937.1 hypothetical protein [Nitrospira sp.]